MKKPIFRPPGPLIPDRAQPKGRGRGVRAGSRVTDSHVVTDAAIQSMFLVPEREMEGGEKGPTHRSGPFGPRQHNRTFLGILSSTRNITDAIGSAMFVFAKQTRPVR
jgi:hypothetical protein